METRHFVTLSNWDRAHCANCIEDIKTVVIFDVGRSTYPLFGVLHHHEAAAVLQHLASLGNCPTLLEPGNSIKGDKPLSDQRPCVLPRGRREDIEKSQRNVSRFRIDCSFTVIIMDNLPNRRILDTISSWMRNLFIFFDFQHHIMMMPLALHPVSTQVGRLVQAWMLE